MVPGAAHGILDEEALGERRTVMRAERIDREHLAAAPCQQYRLIADAPKQHGAIGDLREGKTQGEIGPARLRCFLGHGLDPPRAP